jgi:tetratricopeptide (TPR) repeat protein
MAINTKNRISPFSKRKKIIFVGRADLLTEFERRTSNYTEKPLWYIFGIAGIGKSSLMDQMKFICSENEIPSASVDLADLRYRDEIEVLLALNEQIGAKHFKTFSKKAEKYRQMKEERYRSVAERIKAQGGAISKTAATAIGHVFFPGLGTITRVAAESVQNLLASYFQGEDRTFFENAPNILREVFKRELEDLFRRGFCKRLPLVIFIDTYEEGLSTSIDEFFRSLVRNPDIRAFYVFLAREPLNWDQLADEGDSWKWSSILEEKVELPPLSEKESLEYLARREIHDPVLCKSIIQATGCLPLSLTLAGDLLELGDESIKETTVFEKELSRAVINKLLFELIIEKLPLEEGEEQLIYLAGIPRWFDRAVLGELCGYNLEKTRSAFDLLRDFHFVRPSGPDRAHYHDIIRKSILDRWQEEDPSRENELHKRLGVWFLESYVQNEDLSCLLESYYHRFHFDFYQTFQEWKTDFERITNSLEMASLTSLVLDLESYLFLARTLAPRLKAEVLLQLGNRFAKLTVGEIPEFKEKQIDCYKLALEVRTREAFPVNWAMTQNNLGAAYSDRIKGERADNLEEAISWYKLALEVRTREAFPVDWAMTQNNLGNAYRDRIKGERADNLEEAISCYKLALEVYTREALPGPCETVRKNLDDLLGVAK